MTPARSAEPSPSPLKVVLAALLGVVAMLYAAGYFLLWSLQLAPHEAVEHLVRAAELDVGLDNYRVVSL